MRVDSVSGALPASFADGQVCGVSTARNDGRGAFSGAAGASGAR
jgi:hypothetical protein